MNNNVSDIEIAIRARIDGLKKDISKANTMLRKGLQDGDGIKVVAKMQGELARETDKLTTAMGKGRMQFAGYAMSIMFFGMALQQMSLQVQRFGTKAFNDVMHSVEGTVTQSDYLSASMMYLGFTIGQAFEPVLAFIIPIIEKLAEWVSENEETARTIGVIGIVAGTVFAVGGAAVLALNGFIELFQKLGIATLDAEGKITNMKGVLGSIGGSIAIGFAVSNVIDGIKDLEKGEWANAMFNALSAGMLAAGGLKMIRGQKGGGWMIAIGISADLAANDKFFQGTVGLLTKVTAAFMATFMWLGAELAQALSNPVSRALASMLDSVAKILSMAGWNSMAKTVRAVANEIREVGNISSGREPNFADFMNEAMGSAIVRGISEWAKTADSAMAGIDAPSNRQQVNFNGNIYTVTMPQGMTPQDPAYFDTVLAYLRSTGQIS